MPKLYAHNECEHSVNVELYGKARIMLFYLQEQKLIEDIFNLWFHNQIVKVLCDFFYLTICLKRKKTVMEVLTLNWLFTFFDFQNRPQKWEQ